MTGFRGRFPTGISSLTWEPDPVSGFHSALPLLGISTIVPGSEFTIKVSDPPSGHAQLFDPGDIIRCKAFNGTSVIDNWMRVVSTTDPRTGGVGDETYYEYSVERVYGTPGTLPKGAAIVNFGQTGDGYIKLTSDENHSPFIDIATHLGSPWVEIVPHARIGNLDGVLGLSEQWGIAAGKDISDDTLPHVILSNEQLGLYGVAQTWWDSGSNARGQVDPTAGDNDKLFWLGPSSSDPRLVVYGDGDLWMSMAAIGDSLDKQFFSMANGSLLFGHPLNIEREGSDYYWVSSRGDRAEIEAGFEIGQGRWPGTRSLKLLTGGTNYATNPSVETGTTGWSAREVADSISRTSDESFSGEYSLEVTAAAPNGGVEYEISSGIPTYYDDRHVVIHVMGEPGVNLTVQIRNSADNANLATETVSPTGAWERVTLPYTQSTSGAHVRVIAASSCTFYVDALLIDASAGRYQDLYFDGGSGPGCEWSGSEHASTSVMGGDLVGHHVPMATWINASDCVGHINGRNQITIRIVAQALFDASNSRQFGNIPVLYMTDSGASERIAINSYQTATAGTVVYGQIGDGSDTVTFDGEWMLFDAGEFLDIVITADYSNDEYAFYINGERLCFEEKALSAPSGIEEIYIGASEERGGRGLYAISEFAVLHTVLSSENVAALHAMDAPMCDLGSYEAPGVYITDGRFRLQSSLTGQRVEIKPYGVGIYTGDGETGVSRLIGGVVDTTSKVLDRYGDSLGWFGYDDSDNLQVAWWASGSNKGKVEAGGTTLGGDGMEIGAGASSGAAKYVRFKDGASNLSFIESNNLTALGANILRVGTEAYAASDIISLEADQVVVSGSPNTVYLPTETEEFVVNGSIAASGDLAIQGGVETGGDDYSTFTYSASDLATQIILNNDTEAASGVGARMMFKAGGSNIAWIAGMYRGGTANANKDLDFYAGGDSLAPLLTITGDKRIGVHKTSPGGRMTIDQYDSSGGIPVLELDQADSSEEFINFISSVGDGHPIDTVNPVGSAYGRARVSVNGTIKYVQIYNP